MSRAVLHGDCLAIMPTLDAESVDAIVCDPPAGIAFMGRYWDHDKGGRDQWIAWLASVMREGLRVLKPGGHALVWALPRTSHWTGMALEDAGFEVRDRITHLFGSGFPKSLDVSKAMDKAAGAERGIIGVSPRHGGGTNHVYGEGMGDGTIPLLTAPATDLAKQWDGWGTALKPAAEDWWLARKALAGTVAATVAAHGTGALNIDGCRIAGGSRPHIQNAGGARANTECFGNGKNGSRSLGETSLGRWPANVVLGCNCEVLNGALETDHMRGLRYGVVPQSEHSLPDLLSARGVTHAPDCAVALLDAQSGERNSTRANGNPNQPKNGGIGTSLFTASSGQQTHDYRDIGGASRFYYVAKASRREREAGLEGMPPQGIPWGEGGERKVTAADWGDPDQKVYERKGKAANHHPCVKPLALMRWLCRLVCPPGGLILDPFAGSGSTGCAAVLEGFRFLGIEQDLDYVEISRRRLAYWERVARRYHRLLAYRAAHPVERQAVRVAPSQLGLFGGSAA